MIEIWAFDMGRGSLWQLRGVPPRWPCPDGLASAQSVAGSFGHYPRHGFPRLLSDGRREAMRFRVIDMESFHEQFFSVNTPSVLRFYQWFQLARLSDRGARRGRGRPPHALI